VEGDPLTVEAFLEEAFSVDFENEKVLEVG